MRAAAAVLVGLLLLPIAALFLASSPASLLEGLQSPTFQQAARLSAWTSTLTTVLAVLLGTPLAWWLSRTSSRAGKAIGIAVELPLVVPPAVLGVGLLQAFGQHGLGGLTGLPIAFSPAAVVVAQLVVSAPFFITASTTAFRSVADESLIVARTLGSTPRQAFLRVALPIALPGLVAGASMTWARAVGEFGATLLFAGSLRGVTQTLPVAILQAMESDMSLAVSMSLVLVFIGITVLVSIRSISELA